MMGSFSTSKPARRGTSFAVASLLLPVLLGAFGTTVYGQCPPAPGDANCNGNADVGDIGPFTLALTDPTAYAAQHPDCDIEDLDLNADEVVNGADISAFVVLLTSPVALPTLTYLTQDRLVEGLVRAFDDNSDITVTDDDTAPDFGPFINSVNLFQDSATSGGYADAFQSSHLCARAIQARGDIVVEAIVATNGFSGRAACYAASDFMASFQLAQSSMVRLTGFVQALDTDVFVNAYLTGPEGTVYQAEAEESQISINFETVMDPGVYTLTVECSGEVFNLTPGTFDGRNGEYYLLLELIGS